MSKKAEETSHDVLSESPEGVARLLRSAAHPKRIQILTLLSDGEHEFSKLMQKTKLSKTALANHIRHLTEKGLVQRATRGEYKLTVDGGNLLNAAATLYVASVRREWDRLELMSSRYTTGLIQEGTLRRRVIRENVEFLPCWLSYTGAIAGSLKGLGVDCDIVDVGGNSGYSFLINVAQGKISPSGPTAHNHETWKQIYNGTESLGWTLGHYKYPQVYPARKGSPTPEEIELARELFDRIKQEIDEKDRPVVLSGLVAPEFGIVKGYDGDFYITSTFRSHPLLEINRRTESPILFYDLDAPGGIHAFFFQDRVKMDNKSADEEALQRAVRFARGKISVLDAYVGGPGALDTWANDLESLAEQEVDYMSNSYLGACIMEGRWMSSEFLKRLAKRSLGRRSKRLQQASQSYGKGMSLMKEFVRIFPFKYHGKMRLEDRKKGAETLRKVKTCEEEAIMQMMEAL